MKTMKLKLMDLMVAAMLLSLPAFAETPLDNAKAFAEVLRAEGEFQVATAQSALLFAQSNLVNAQAAHEWVRVRELTLLVNRLELELRKAAKREFELARQASILEDRTRSLQVIKTGKTSPFVFQAFRFIIMRTVPAQQLADIMGTPVKDADSSQFLPNRAQTQIEDFPGGTVGELLTFAERKNYSFSPFSPAHLELLSSFGRLETLAVERAAELRDKVEELTRHMPAPIPEPRPVPGNIPGPATPPAAPQLG